MCGRLSLVVGWSEIYEQYRGFLDAAAASNAPPRYNVTPMQDLDFVAKRDGKFIKKTGQWWLVPHWVKKAPEPGEKKYAMFNARVETVASSPGFRDAFKYGRCIIFSDGYFEWTKNPDDGGKDPHYIYLPDHRPFAFAGLWSHNQAMDVTSCTIVTAPAIGPIREIHARMPVILDDEVIDDWMEMETGKEEALELLQQNSNRKLLSHRVGRAVNSNRAEGPELIEPLDPENED